MAKQSFPFNQQAVSPAGPLPRYPAKAKKPAAGAAKRSALHKKVKQGLSQVFTENK